MSKELLTMHEANILFYLAEAWYRYTLLPNHPTGDITDFRKAIQDAQRVILARVGRRQLQHVGGDGPIVPEMTLEQLKELAQELKALDPSKKSHGITTDAL